MGNGDKEDKEVMIKQVVVEEDLNSRPSDCKPSVEPRRHGVLSRSDGAQLHPMMLEAIIAPK